jgi:hypothetical protein
MKSPQNQRQESMNETIEQNKAMLVQHLKLKANWKLKNIVFTLKFTLAPVSIASQLILSKFLHDRPFPSVHSSFTSPQKYFHFEFWNCVTFYDLPKLLWSTQ